MPNQKLQQARCLLLARQPWYGHAAMSMEWTPTRRVSSMGVRIVAGGVVQCLYNPDYVERHRIEELFTVIQHEVEHVVRRHCLRTGGRPSKHWNLACDMCVNGRRSEPSVGYFDPQTRELIIPEADGMVWIPQDWPTGQTAEYYFRRLQGSANSLQLPEESETSFDSHAVWQDSDVTAAEAVSVAKGMAQRATYAANGTVPGHLQEELRRLANAQVSWKVLLRRHLGQAIAGRRRSSSRRNRRRDQFGFPGYTKRRTTEVSVIVDVSGSISRRQIEHFFGEIESICRCASVNVLLWDHQFEGFFPEYQTGDWRSIPLRGRGGTDMAAPVTWLLDHHAVGDCVVMLTDGLCEWPSPQSFAFIAVISSPPDVVEEPGWGRSLYLELD